MQPALPKIRPRRILIVDAEDAFRRKAVFALKGAGHEAWGYSEVREGVVAAAFRSPDLILVDFGLTGKGASELFRHVRDREETAHVPFLFYSRGGHPLEIRRGISVPAGVILRKPFTARKLLEFLQPMFRRLAKVTQLGQQDAVSGALSDLDLHDLLGALRHFHRSGILTLFSGDGRSQAVTRFVDGTPISARTGKLEGPEVLLEITTWQDGNYDFRAYPADTRPALPPPSAREPWLELMTSLQMLDQARLNPFPLKLQEDAELSHEGSDQTHELETHAIVGSAPSMSDRTSDPAAGLDEGLLLHPGLPPSDASTTSTLELDAARVLKPGQASSESSVTQDATLELVPGAAVGASAGASVGAAELASELSGAEDAQRRTLSEATLELVPLELGEGEVLDPDQHLVTGDTDQAERAGEASAQAAADLSEPTGDGLQPDEGDRTLHLLPEHLHTPDPPGAQVDAPVTLEHALVDLTRSDLTPIELLAQDRTRSDLTPIELLAQDRTRSDLTPIELSAQDRTRTDLTPIELLPDELSPADDVQLELTPMELTPMELTPMELTPGTRLSPTPAAVALSLSQTGAQDRQLDRTSATTDRLPGNRLARLSSNARRENTDELRLEDIINAAEPELAADLRAGLLRMKDGAVQAKRPLLQNPFHDDELSGELDVALARLLEGEGVLISPPPTQEEPEELVPDLLPELDMLDLTPTPGYGRGRPDFPDEG